MNVTELIYFFNEYWTLATLGLAVLGVGLERSSIKINPYSTFFRWIGSLINQEMRTELQTMSLKIDNIQKELDSHVYESDKKEFKRLRTEILDFAKCIRKGEKFQLEHFQHIIDSYSDYHRYTAEKGFINGYLDEEFEYIKENFRELQRKNI